MARSLSPIAGDDADQGALTSLASSADEHDTGVSEGGVHLSSDATGDEVR
jgi:hypothetical protein